MHRAIDDANQCRRYLTSRGTERRANAALVSEAKISSRACVDRIAARHQVKEQNAQAVDVALGRRPLPAKHFWCQVQWCSGQIGRRAVVKLSSGPEVHQDNASVVGEHHVLRLDVAMQQASRMNRRDRLADLGTDTRRFNGGERRALLEDLFERAPADIFHP